MKIIKDFYSKFAGYWLGQIRKKKLSGQLTLIFARPALILMFIAGVVTLIATNWVFGLVIVGSTGMGIAAWFIYDWLRIEKFEPTNNEKKKYRPDIYSASRATAPTPYWNGPSCIRYEHLAFEQITYWRLVNYVAPMICVAYGFFAFVMILDQFR